MVYTCILPICQNLNEMNAFYEGSNLITRGPRTLALCLTAAVGMTLAIFSADLYQKLTAAD